MHSLIPALYAFVLTFSVGVLTPVYRKCFFVQVRYNFPLYTEYYINEDSHLSSSLRIAFSRSVAPPPELDVAGVGSLLQARVTRQRSKAKSDEDAAVVVRPSSSLLFCIVCLSTTHSVRPCLSSSACRQLTASWVRAYRTSSLRSTPSLSTR